MSCYITEPYGIMHDGQQIYVRKIGHSSDIKKRLSFLNTFIADPVEKWCEISSDKSDVLLESLLHSWFSDYHLDTKCARELFVGLSDKSLAEMLDALKAEVPEVSYCMHS